MTSESFIKNAFTPSCSHLKKFKQLFKYDISDFFIHLQYVPLFCSEITKFCDLIEALREERYISISLFTIHKIREVLVFSADYHSHFYDLFNADKFSAS